MGAGEEEDWEEGEKEVKEEEREGRLRRVAGWICRWIGESRGTRQMGG